MSSLKRLLNDDAEETPEQSFYSKQARHELYQDLPDRYEHIVGLFRLVLKDSKQHTSVRGRVLGRFVG